MLEKSWAGFEIHTEHGYNVGKPCYGYCARHVPHPVPAKRAKGVKKTLLEPHPFEGPVVAKIFLWRVVEQLGYQTIADRLNEDLITNPPPTPILVDTAVGRWTHSNVRDILTNPKYTGHMVWNRRARKGGGRNRPNPVEEWVWSPEPVHEALVSLEAFVQAQQVAEHRERSRSTPGTNKHPRAQRTYRLRSYLFCPLCGRRFYGKTSKGVSYYVCAPKKANRPDDHPPSIWVKEDTILNGLTDFLSTHVFGPYRHELLTTHLTTLDAAQQQERAQRIDSLRKAITETDTKRKRLIRSLENIDEPSQDLIQDINERRAELGAHRDDLQQQLDELEGEAHQAPNPDLLACLPISPIDLAGLPDAISRRLFEALRLEIFYDRGANVVSYAVTLTGETVKAVARTAQEAAAAPEDYASASRNEKECEMKTGRAVPPRHPSVWRPRQDSNLRPSA
ncbi:recombinase family protein [Streptomyces sp. Rer75]|uniref:recombinase family protein n=1 Tax=Streptomyces sp. Rer75 TaxID=2750011 RepID=UPI00211E2D83|nr:recombinase family protein [Streptomyces sp. Rer75]